MKMTNAKKITWQVLVYIALVTTSCSNKIINLERVKCSFRMPIGINDGIGEKEKIDIFISHYSHYTLYEIPYHNTLSERVIGEEGKMIYDSLKYNYFILNDKNKYGYYLEKSILDSFNRKINKDDNVLKNRTFDESGEAVNVKNLGAKKIEIIKTNASKFIVKHLIEDKYYDSAYLYFDKNEKDLRFYLSKSQDSIYGAKFYKIEMFLKNDSLKKANPHLKDFFINSYEIKKEKSIDEESLINLFKRFEAFDKNQ
jgi:hypothetical protein